MPGDMPSGWKASLTLRDDFGGWTSGPKPVGRSRALKSRLKLAHFAKIDSAIPW
jgi:hypothetical protein